MTHTQRADTLAESIRQDFPIFDQPASGGLPLAYLDNAATTHKPRAVLDAITDYYARANSNVGRGYYQLSMRSTDRYEQARSVVRDAIGARHDDEIVFTSGTTSAINLLVSSAGSSLVGRGDEVVVTGMEHNSNLLPWRRLCEQAGARLVVAPVNDRGVIDAGAFAACLGPRTKLAAMTHVSNVLGTVNPVGAMIAEAHKHGVVVVVDGAQAVAHRRVNVEALDADFYCFSAHKVYGPMGVGVLYGKRDLLAELPPYQVGGGTVKGVRHDLPVDYVAVPARMEAGTPNVAGAVGLAAALRYLDELGWDRISRHDEQLVRYAIEAVAGSPRAQVIGDPSRKPSGIVSFVVDGIHPYDVGGHLDQHGIAVRCGVHCASTFLDSLGLLGTVRLSFGVYNTEAELGRVHAALATVRPGTWTKDHPATRFL